MTKHHSRHDDHKPNVRNLWKEISRLDLSHIKDSTWVIQNFLAESSTQVIFGEFGTGKTTAMLWAAWCVSQGLPFLGMSTKRRAVLYLDYENPPHVVKRYCEGLGIDPRNPWFSIWDRKGRIPIPGSKRLARFAKRCKQETGFAPWIIFDSWTSLLRGDDSGNQVGETAPIFRKIRHLCDNGVSCSVIDHSTGNPRTGHSGGVKMPAGSIAKMTQMDTSHTFVKENEEPDYFDSGRGNMVVSVESFLKRYAPKDEGSFSFQLKGSKDAKGNWNWHSVERAQGKDEAERQDVIDRVKRVIRHNPTSGLKELAEKIADKKIMGRNSAITMLKDGTGKVWETITSGTSHKQAFRLLKVAK
jgi:RecA-family ATPase